MSPQLSEHCLGSIETMAEIFKWRKVTLTIDKKLEIIKFIDPRTSYTAPVWHKVQHIFCPRTFAPRMNVFVSQPGRIQLLYETRSNEKLNTFKWEAKTCSDEKPNAFKRDTKRLLTASKTRSSYPTISEDVLYVMHVVWIATILELPCANFWACTTIIGVSNSLACIDEVLKLWLKGNPWIAPVKYVPDFLCCREVTHFSNASLCLILLLSRVLCEWVARNSRDCCVRVWATFWMLRWHPSLY